MPGAIEAMGVSRVAVQFDDPLARNAGGLMQPVDVLGDDRADFAAANQFGDRTMTAVGGSAAKNLLHRKAAPPGFAPRLFRGEKIGKIDRRHAGPDAARAAEIGNAGFSADAGAGKDHGAARLFDQSGEFGDLRIIEHGPIVANRHPSAKCRVGSRGADR